MMKKMVRFIALVLALVLTMQLLPAMASAASESDLTFTLNEDGESYSVTDCNEAATGALVIPSTIEGYPVTSIGESAFYNCASLTAITIPDSVTSIGESAFSGCGSLESMTIPFAGQLTYTDYTDYYVDFREYPFGSIFGTSSYSGSVAITQSIRYREYEEEQYIVENTQTYYLPASLKEITVTKEIRRFAFENCSNLTSVTIGSGVTSIGWKAFSGCTGLKDVYITDPIAWCNIRFDFVYGSFYSDRYGWRFDYEYDYTSSPMYYADQLHILDKNGNEMSEVAVDYDGEIPAYAFKGCTSLISIHAKSYGVGALSGCSKLGLMTIDAMPITKEDVFDEEIYSGKGTLSDYAYWEYPFERAFGTDSYVGSIGVERDNIYRYKKRVTDSFSRWSAESCTYYIPASLNKVVWAGAGVPDGAFADWTNIKNVEILDSATSIGSQAFSYCNSLTSIIIPDSVTSIGSQAFSYCNSLADIYYNGTQEQWDAVTIDSGNSPLTNATIHFKEEIPSCLVYEIANGEVTITDCDTSAAGELVIPSTIEGHPVTRIGDDAFWRCDSLTSMTIPDSVTSIGKHAFSWCTSLTSVTIGSSVTSIGGYAFSNCTSLTSITIPDGVTSIGSSAFSGCTSLTSITIPDSVTSIDSYAFDGCTSLTSITIPDSVTSISGYAFSGCTSLTSITIPDSVTGIGGYVFYNCTDLTSVSISNAVTAIRDYVFYNCTSLTSITIPDSVTSISGYAFSGCTSLTSIAIPDGVTRIGNYAFSGCTSLTSITIPDSVTSIGTNTFYSVGLTDVYYDGTQEQWNAITIAGGNKCLTNATLHLTEVITEIARGTCGDGLSWVLGTDGVLTITGSGAMDDYAKGTAPWYAYQADLKNVVVAEGVTHIGNSAFRGCTSLVSITMPDTVESIGSHVFYGCTNLVSAPLPAQLYSLGDAAFYNCGKLESVTIPETIVWIGYSSFHNCKSLTSVEIPGSVVYVDDSAFRGCTGLKTVVIGDGLTDLGTAAFRDCTALTSITIPDSISTIAKDVFTGCTSLKRNAYDNGLYLGNSGNPYLVLVDTASQSITSITIHEDTKIIGHLAFDGCSALTEVVVPDSVSYISEAAFSGCSGLESISLPMAGSIKSNATDIYQYPLGYIFGSTSYTGGVATTQYYYSLSTEEETECVYYIPASLKNVTVTGSEIQRDAFYNCSGLTSVSVTENMTAIGDAAFYGCTGLTDVYFDGKQSQWDTITIGSGNECLTNASIHMAIPSGTCGEGLYWALENGSELIIYGNGAMRDYSKGSAPWYSYLTSIKTVVVKNGVTSIGTSAFRDCTALTGITIPGSVVSIGDHAFNSCRKLTNVVIPNGVLSIGASAFTGCTGLTGITLSNSVESIGSSAFSGCSVLTGITIPDSVTSIGASAFYNCRALKTVTIGKGVTSIGNSAFSLCIALSEVTIGKGVTSIGTSAFYNCSRLADVYYDGVQAQWNAITIGSNNTPLTKATLHCNIILEKEDGTLQLTADGAQDSLVLAAGRVLDLNGYVLTVDSLASFGQIIDSVGGGGLIATNIEITGNEWLPILDSTGCYRFYEYEVENLGTKSGTDSVIFGFTLDFVDAAAYTALLNSDDVQINVNLNWGSNSKTFAFSKDLIQRYVELQSKYPQLRPYMKLNVTGTDSLADGTVLTVTPIITAVGGKNQNVGNAIEHVA